MLKFSHDKSYQIEIVVIFEFKDRNDMETDQGPRYKLYGKRSNAIFNLGLSDS